MRAIPIRRHTAISMSSEPRGVKLYTQCMQHSIHEGVLLIFGFYYAFVYSPTLYIQFRPPGPLEQFHISISIFLVRRVKLRLGFALVQFTQVCS